MLSWYGEKGYKVVVMRGLVLRRASRATRSTPSAALKALFGIRPLQDIITVQAAKAYYEMRIVKLLKDREPSEFRSAKILGMPSDRISLIRKFRIRF